MQRRTLWLFALFVVTAWFYASLADDSGGVVVKTHEKQVQALQQVEQLMSGAEEPVTESTADLIGDQAGARDVDAAAGGANSTTPVVDNS